MKIKNLSTITLTFPTGQSVAAKKEITISDEAWANMQSNETVQNWLAAGILELDGAPYVRPPVDLSEDAKALAEAIKGDAAPGGGTYAVTVKITQAAYDALSGKDANTLYVIGA